MSSVDRLSALPVPVLCHILSFLPTQTSVSTSILGRRWRFLWTHVPNIDLDCDNENTETDMADIIHRVMLLQKAKNINTFRLSCVNSSLYQLETWITTTIERNVQNLDLDFLFKMPLPRCLFTCKTLVDLSIRNGQLLPSRGAIYLPTLKKLSLCFVEYEDDEALNRVLFGCPALEELIIDDITLVDQESGCLSISSPTVRRLNIHFQCGGYSYEYESYDYSLKINAPALEYFNVYRCSLDHISLSPITMASLIEADVYLDCNCNCGEDNHYVSYLVKFLDCLYNVRCLKLSGCFEEECFDMVVAASIVKFDHLIKLELGWDVDTRFIIKFLEIADNLEVLTVNGIFLKCWVDPKQVPTCLLLHLRIIRIQRMRCTEDELNMVKYLLRNGKVLERMYIYFRDSIGVKTKSDVIKRIPLFERGSKACQIAFC